MTETIKIQVIFEENILGTTYRDAIYYDSQASLDQAKLDGKHEFEKSKRIVNFENLLKNPPVSVPPTKKQLQDEKAELESRIAQLDEEIGKK